MDTKAYPQCVETPEIESLESRLLLDAGGLAHFSAPVAGPAPEASPIVLPAPEYESNGGPANDDYASAQELEFSYLLPKLSPFDGFGPQQASVTGSADGSGGSGYIGHASRGAGNFVHPYSFSLTFQGATAPGAGGILKVLAYADLTGAAKYVSLVAEGIELGDLFVEGGATNVWVNTEVSLTREQLALLAADGEITFTVSPSVAVQDVGTGIVMMELTYGGGGGAGDFYRLDLGAGESASMALTSPESAELDLALFDADGTELATGEPGAGGVAAAIDHFVAETDGTFYVRISGSGDYQLTVNRNATTDLEENDDIESAQQVRGAEVNGRQWIVGVLDNDPLGTEADFYAVTLAPRGSLDVRAYGPGNNGKGDSSALSPVLRLYDSDGQMVAAGEGSRLQYRAPRWQGGTYYVALSGADGTGGHYVLSVKAHGSDRAAASGQVRRQDNLPEPDGPALTVQAAQGQRPGPKAAKPTSNGRAGNAAAGPVFAAGAAEGWEEAGDSGKSPKLGSVLSGLPALLDLLG